MRFGGLCEATLGTEAKRALRPIQAFTRALHAPQLVRLNQFYLPIRQQDRYDTLQPL